MYDWIPAMLPGSGPAAQGTVSAALVNRIIRGAVELGASRPQLISVLGFNEARLRNPANRMAWQLMERLFGELERHFGDPAIVLRLGEFMRPQSFSDIGFATRLAPNLAEVIEANCQIQAIRQNIVSVHFDRQSAPPKLIWGRAKHETEIAAFAEFSLATYMRLSVPILGETMKMQRIHFKHAQRLCNADYQAAFNCPVYFNMPQTEAWLDPRQLMMPSLQANPMMLQAAMDHYKLASKMMESGQPNAGHGYFYLTSELDKTPATLQVMAASYGINERTLRRKLLAEGYPFRDLLDLVRKKLCALYQMENKRSLGEIAHLLGYGELSAFSRAHRRWYGYPPSKGCARHEAAKGNV
jgi:AraC-like DNA-binding protein